MKAWQFADIIDLNFFFETDAAVTDAESLAELDLRDRTIFLEEIKGVWPLKKDLPAEVKRQILRVWLNARRRIWHSESSDHLILPGAVYQDTYRLTRLLICLFGMITGIMTALSCLIYAGHQPINVFIFMGILVCLPLTFSVVSGMVILIRPQPSFNSLPFYRFIARNLVLMVERFSASALKKYKRNGSGHPAVFPIGRSTVIGGKLFFWPVFQLVQFFGIFFSLGALGITLARLTTVDLAFGWQTTLPVTGDTLYSVLHLVAAPWNFLWGPDSPLVPSPEQIDGSRIVLKEGIHHLRNTDLRAWWPFLLLSLIVYGLLPRCFLAVTGRVLMQINLKRDLDVLPGTDTVLLRMQTPAVQTQSPSPPGTFTGLPDPESDPMPSDPGVDQPADSAADSVSPAAVLIPEELSGLFSGTGSAAALFGFNPSEQPPEILLETDMDADQPAIERLISSLPEHPPPVVLWIIEAWQPPVRELIVYMNRIRELLGPRVWIRIGLVGLHIPGKGWRPARDDQIRAWQHAIHQRKDPAMRIDILDMETGA